MRLLYTVTSPYARKVRAVLIEKRLEGAVELVAANPLADTPALRTANPLGKVPTLLLEDGRALFDSPVICEHFDLAGRGPHLIPRDPDARLAVLTRQALADGIMDAAFSLVMERKRPEAQRSPEWTERWTGAILRSVRALPTGRPVDGIDLGDLAAACALAYLEFRLPDLDWRAGNYGLSQWCSAVSARPSLASTAPPAA